MNKILLVCSVLVVAAIASVAPPAPRSAGASRAAPASVALETAGPAGAHSEGLSIPDALRLDSAASCRRAGGVCTSPQLCAGSGGHPNGFKCPAGEQCCVP